MLLERGWLAQGFRLGLDWGLVLGWLVMDFLVTGWLVTGWLAMDLLVMDSSSASVMDPQAADWASPSSESQLAPSPRLAQQ